MLCLGPPACLTGQVGPEGRNPEGRRGHSPGRLQNTSLEPDLVVHGNLLGVSRRLGHLLSAFQQPAAVVHRNQVGVKSHLSHTLASLQELDAVIRQQPSRRKPWRWTSPERLPATGRGRQLPQYRHSWASGPLPAR